MLQGIDEKHQLQLLCILGLIVEVLHAFVSSFLEQFNVSYSFVSSWTELNDCTLIISLVSNEEISKGEEFVSSEFIIDFCLHSKAVNGDVVDGVDDCVLVFVVD